MSDIRDSIKEARRMIQLEKMTRDISYIKERKIRIPRIRELTGAILREHPHSVFLDEPDDIKADELFIACEKIMQAQQARITELETITDEKVERVARALAGCYYDDHEGDCNHRTKHNYMLWAWDSFKSEAKAALKAAIGGDDE